jgi:hypothetical protein
MLRSLSPEERAGLDRIPSKLGEDAEDRRS